MKKKPIQQCLDLGKTVKISTDRSTIVIGKGYGSLSSWLESGPHGEMAQDSMDDGYFEEDFQDY